MAKIHITSGGDTFDLLALKYYNDEKLAGTIIQENPDYCDVIIFDAGTVLTIPDRAAATPPETLPPWRRST